MSTLWRIMVREWRRIVAQPLCWGCMIGAPLFGILFFVTLLNEGLPEHIPTAVVDLDNSALSRSFVRQLQAQQAIDIALQCDTYIDAVQAMQRNEVYGFVLIPSRFEELLFDGKQPPLSFYTNDAYLIPGSLLYECYTTQSMLMSAAVIQDLLLSLGFSPQRIMSLLQPIAIDSHALGNPWVNYSIYLSNSFLPAMLQLMVLLVTMYAVASEFKKGSVRSWQLAARGSFLMALAGKLLV
ncbi:MAG: ABC transporter permease, partial [Muribaculaceae bacterium]|nr:ABC transporter permease [Muribaculaceae bacterium]